MPPDRATTTLSSLVDAAAAQFAQRFGRTPAVVAAAPGRINLIGEHTDYSHGLALPLAINRWIVAALDRADAHTTIVLPDIDRVVQCTRDDPRSPAALGQGDPRRDAAAVIGVLRRFDAIGDGPGELNVLVTGNVPIGAGLSSSAALEVAVAAALNRTTGAALDPHALAKLCQQAEHDWLATPCGIMDMLTATRAVAGHALRMDSRDESCRPIPLPPAGQCAVLVINTGVRRTLADGAYADRRATCAHAARRLGVPSLRDATLAMLDQARLPDALRRCGRHVLEENQRVRAAVTALEANPPRLHALGDILFAGHDSLRDLYAVSCAELDCIVETARALRRRGLLFGSRLTGAGFGGCAIALCPPHAIEDVIDSIHRDFAKRFDRDPDIFEAHAVGAAGVV